MSDIEIKVGNTVLLVEEGINVRHGGEPRRKVVPITKVGRKYFYVDGIYGGDVIFFIDSLRENYEGPCSNYNMYKDEEEYQECVKLREARKEFGDKFMNNLYRRFHESLNLSQLERITEIIEENNND